jgi:hypothetical protein
MRKRRWIGIVVGLAAVLAAPTGAQAATESLVTVGSQSLALPFPQNKQNEPSVAIDPSNPNVLAAGSNDEIDEPPCDGSDCPFAQGVGNSGVYFSFNGGSSWNQPTYQGFSGRSGTLGPGPIGTLPHYAEQGLVSDGDPGVVFGPRPAGNGTFSWANGSRLYYSNLTSNFSTERSEATFRGFEAIAVSHADRVQSAAGDDASAWSDPAIVTRQHQSQTTFSDKPAITADNAASSPHFGNVYSCYSRFNSQQPDGPIKIGFSRSTDGGMTFSSPKTLSTAAKVPTQDGRQGCSMATDSHGNVYVAWEDAVHKASVFKLARSTDGGRSFSTPRVVAHVSDVGIFDGVRSFSFDGIAGARTSSFPSLAIANGAPTGAGAPNTIALGWSDGADGLNHEHALVQLSGNGGATWTSPAAVEQSGDRPDFAFLDISPDGSDLYVVYDGFGDPFRNNTTAPRRFVGVVRHADVSGTSLGPVTTLDRGAVGDARASSANALIDEFIGDYNTVDATNAGAVATFNDARSASVCPAINAFRQATVDGTAGLPPAPGSDCAVTFGNTDIVASVAADPSP